MFSCEQRGESLLFACARTWNRCLSLDAAWRNLPLAAPSLSHRHSDYEQNCLACVRNRSDECDRQRLVAIWNSLTGVKPVKSFKNAKAGAGRIWERIQSLGETPKPKAEPKAKRGAQAAKGAPAKAKATKKAIPTKKAPKAKKAAKPAKAESGPREGSKTAQVVAMLQRKNGATLAEIMEKMGWQKHTVRGFMAGAMKKAGYTVESFKSDKG